MGKLRERSGAPPFGATKKQGAAFAGERALKNRIVELERELEQARANEREQAHAIARLGEERRDYAADVSKLQAQLRELTGHGSLSRGLYTAKEAEEMAQRKITEFAAAMVVAAGKVPR